MNKILVPIDFSNCSIAALDVAVEVSRKASSEVSLLNVLVDPFSRHTESEVYVPLELKENDRQKYLEILTKDAKGNLENLKVKFPEPSKVKCEVVTGSSAYKSILEYAEIYKPSLIVMGTNGANNFKEIFIGTNAERIVRLTAIPVLVVGQKIEKKDITTIVFPSDFQPAARVSFPVVDKFAKLFGAKIHLLRVNTADDDMRMSYAMGKMGLIKKEFEGDFEMATIDAKTVEEGIVKYAEKVKADLIAMGVYRRKGPARFLTDRITEGVLRLTTIPVLTVDLPKEA